MTYMPTTGRWHGFRLSGERYRFGTTGVDAVRLVNDMIRAMEEGSMLFRFRPRIRQLRSRSCRAALAHLVEVAPDQRTRLIAIWLRGQCGGYIGTATIERSAFDRSERIRCAVARALQSMSAWGMLDSMSRNDPSPRVRRLAAPRQQRSFVDRFHQFSNDIESIPTPRNARHHLHVAPGFQITCPTSAKSAAVIRRILEHIRFLVRFEHKTARQ